MGLCGMMEGEQAFTQNSIFRIPTLHASMGSAPIKMPNPSSPVKGQSTGPPIYASENKANDKPSIPGVNGSGKNVTITPLWPRAKIKPPEEDSCPTENSKTGGEQMQGQNLNIGGGEVEGQNQNADRGEVKCKNHNSGAGEVSGKVIPGRHTQNEDISSGQETDKFPGPSEQDKNSSGEVQGKLSKPERTSDNCTHSDGRNKAGFCTSCGSFICKDCLASHSAANIDHIMLGPSAMPVNKIYITKNSYGLCALHETESNQYFCPSHNTDCCKTCLVLSHRQCNGIKHRSKQILDEQMEAGSDFVRANTIVIVRPKQPIRPCKCRYECRIDARHTNDSARCDVTGTAVFDSNFLVIADNWNSSVKMIDVKQRQIVSYLRLPLKPWDVTKVLEKQLVVTCSLKLIMIDAALKSLKLTIRRNIQVKGQIKGQFRGTVYSESDGCLVVSCIGTHSAVAVMKLDGTVLYTFTTDANKQPLFAKPEYLTVIGGNEENETKIMVSDSRNNTVTCLNRDGAVLGSYTNKRLKNPKGLAIDDTGSTLVAGWGSETVDRISENCDQIQTILEKDDIITYPQSMSVCKDTNLVFISHYHYQAICNFISVYKILPNIN